MISHALVLRLFRQGKKRLAIAKETGLRYDVICRILRQEAGKWAKNKSS